MVLECVAVYETPPIPPSHTYGPTYVVLPTHVVLECVAVSRPPPPSHTHGPTYVLERGVVDERALAVADGVADDAKQLCGVPLTGQVEETLKRGGGKGQRSERKIQV